MSPSRKIHLGISTCPNDTFLFDAILNGKIETPGLHFDVELLDVQELNRRLSAGEFDVAKASYHLALRHGDGLIALPTGSALGFGNGPLLLARKGLEGTVPGPDSRVLCPGRDTTATLLYELFYASSPRRSAAPEQVVFSDVMPALEAGTADYGVCIHEGRFTYEQSGLALIEDLGAAWESETKTPLPLGGLFARRTLDESTLNAVQDALRRSLLHAQAHPEDTFNTMAAHAQELEESVIWEHVDLYVNGWTRRLGDEGKAAIEALSSRAREAGLIHEHASLEVFEPSREKRLFHLVRADGPEEADRTPESVLDAYEAPSLAAEGFVHLSFADQVPGTLAVHFAEASRVLLLEVRRSAVLEDLRVEASRGGDDFPHLYRALRVKSDVLDVLELCLERGEAEDSTKTEEAPRWTCQRALPFELSRSKG